MNLALDAAALTLVLAAGYLAATGHHKTAAAPATGAAGYAAARYLAKRAAADVEAAAIETLLRSLTLNPDLTAQIAAFVTNFIAKHAPVVAPLEPELANTITAASALAVKAFEVYALPAVAKALGQTAPK